jgi:hypothetical protein
VNGLSSISHTYNFSMNDYQYGSQAGSFVEPCEKIVLDFIDTHLMVRNKMTQAERGLFERIREGERESDDASNFWERIAPICAEFEQRLADAKEAIDSNLLVECALAGVQYSGSYADGIMALRDRLAEAEKVVKHARAVNSHWNEFGPEHGFAERMDWLHVSLTAPLPEKKYE